MHRSRIAKVATIGSLQCLQQTVSIPSQALGMAHPTIKSGEQQAETTNIKRLEAPYERPTQPVCIVKRSGGTPVMMVYDEPLSAEVYQKDCEVTTVLGTLLI